METKKAILFFTLMFTLFMGLGANMYADIDDPILDPDTFDQPRVTLPTLRNNISSNTLGSFSSTLQQQSTQRSVSVFSQSGELVPILKQSDNATLIYFSTVNTNNISVTPSIEVRPY